MTIEQLSQYRSLKSEIAETAKKIRQLESSDVVTGSDSEYPYIKHCMSVIGVDMAAVAEELTRLRKLYKQCREQYTEINKFIDAIKDSQTRRIFRMRYIEGERGLSWQAIAYRLGEYDEQYPRRKHNNYLAKSQFDENDEIRVLK